MTPANRCLGNKPSQKIGAYGFFIFFETSQYHGQSALIVRFVNHDDHLLRTRYQQRQD